MDNEDKTFIRITNKEIYDEMTRFHEKNSQQHNEIIKRLDITNGKVKLSKWIATTALTISLIVLAYFVSHISQVPRV